MSTKTNSDELSEITAPAGSAGGERSEPGGRAQRAVGGALFGLPDAVRDRLSDEVID